MDKKLPGVFANKIDKKLTNNKNVFYSDKEEVGSDRNTKAVTNKLNDSLNINQKINQIFNSPRYVYKASVDIVLKSGKVTKNIVGKNGNYLITLENELIPISDIVDIGFSK